MSNGVPIGRCLLGAVPCLGLMRGSALSTLRRLSVVTARPSRSGALAVTPGGMDCVLRVEQ